jgi:hypothetical protein
MTIGMLMERICRSAELIGLPHADPAGYYLVAADQPGVRMEDDWPVAACSQSNKGSITLMLRLICGGTRPASYAAARVETVPAERTIERDVLPPGVPSLKLRHRKRLDVPLGESPAEDEGQLVPAMSETEAVSVLRQFAESPMPSPLACDVSDQAGLLPPPLRLPLLLAFELGHSLANVCYVGTSSWCSKTKNKTTGVAGRYRHRRGSWDWGVTIGSGAGCRARRRRRCRTNC